MTDAESLTQRGKELLHTEQFEKAIQYFTKAIELDAAFPEAYKNRSEAYARLGRSDEAQADLQQANTLGAEKTTTNLERGHDLIIDNLYDELFPKKVTEIDNVYDELFSGPSEDQNFQVVLEFLDGSKEEAAQAVLFQPTAYDITVVSEEDNTECVLPLNRFSCIRTAKIPAAFPEIEESCQVENIDINNGNNYQVYVPADQGMESGLFGFSTREDDFYKYSFFPYSNIKSRCQKRFLGEILVDKGMISSLKLEQALEEHKQLINRKLGQIIAEQANISKATVENEINKYFSENEKKIKVGEILLAAGLVDEGQVGAALETQKKLKKIKIGQFLIKRGILKEEEVYTALAEKFRIQLVDLRRETLSREVLRIVPRELVLKLRVLPISLRNSTLVVATMTPDIPELKDIISKYTGQYTIQFVLARPTQLLAAIRKVYQQNDSH